LAAAAIGTAKATASAIRARRMGSPGAGRASDRAGLLGLGAGLVDVVGAARVVEADEAEYDRERSVDLLGKLAGAQQVGGNLGHGLWRERARAGSALLARYGENQNAGRDQRDSQQ